MGGFTSNTIGPADHNTMNSSTFLLLSAVVIAIASCAPKDSVVPSDVVPESDTLLQLKQQMADLSAQNSALHQRVQNLEESLTSTTSPAESLLQAGHAKFSTAVKRCRFRDSLLGLYMDKDKKTPC